MKIATKLMIAAWVPALVACIIGVALFFSYKVVETAQDKDRTVQRVINSLHELNLLVDCYILYHEKRPKQQFLLEYDAIVSLLTEIRFGNAEQQRYLESIRQEMASMRDTFLKLISNYEKPGSTPNAAMLKEAEDRLAGQIRIRSRDGASSAMRLERLIDEEITTTQAKINGLILFLIFSTTVPLTLALQRMMTNIKRSLATLRTGTEVIGAGNLNHRIGLARRDEIGELAGAFDRMTGQLRDTTVSRDDLGREVEERKRAEEGLRRQREWLRVILSSIGDAVIATDAAGRITFLNPVAITLTGWQPDQALGQPIQTVFRIINELTREPAEDIVKRVLGLGRGVNLANNTALITRDGREIPIEDSAAPIRESTGQTIGVVLVFHDVAEKRRAQARLRESEARRSIAMAAGKLGAWETDLVTGRSFWDEQIAGLLGVDPAEKDEVSDGWMSFVHPEDRPRVADAFRSAAAGCAPYDQTLRILRADGVERWFAVCGEPVRDASGAFVRMIGVAQDITERQRAEEALRHSEARLKRSQQIAHLGSWELDLEKNALTWSDEVYRIFGLPPQQFEATYEAFLASVHPDDRQKVDDAYSGSLRENRDAYEFEHRVVRPGGEIRYVHEKCEHHRNGSGRIIRSVGMVHDITDRKRAEEFINRKNAILAGINRIFNRVLIPGSEEELGKTILAVAEELTGSRLSFIGELAPDGCLHPIAVSNPGWDSCSVVDPTGRRLPGFFPIHGLYERVLQDGQSLLCNNPSSHPDSTGVPEGHPALNAFLGVPLTTAGGTIGMVGVANREGGYRPEDQEVLESLASTVGQALRHQRAERQVNASLKEKEVLLQEIHHRVKNNMQVVRSLLNLQAATIQDPRLIEHLREAGNRVNAMAIVHETLYQSDSLAEIDLSTYLKRLSSSLARIYETTACRISVSIEAEPVNLGIDQTVPCGLVLNELISNAFKHAFPGYRSGEIKINASMTPNHDIALMVSDNGVGLPHGFDARHTRTLGFKLIFGLVETQLDGTVSIECGPGTRFAIHFPRKK